MTFFFVAKCWAKTSLLFYTSSLFWVTSGFYTLMTCGCSLSQTLYNSIFQKKDSVLLSSPLKHETNPQRQGFTTEMTTISMKARKMMKIVAKSLLSLQMVIMMMVEMEATQIMIKFVYLKDWKRVVPGLNSLVYSPSLLNYPLFWYFILMRTMKQIEMATAMPIPMAQLQNQPEPALQKASKTILIEYKGRQMMIKDSASSPIELKANLQNIYPDLFYVDTCLPNLLSFIIQSITRQIRQRIPPRTRKDMMESARKVKLLERSRNIYIPFMLFGEVVYYKQSYTPLKFRIPARNLRGSRPLKTGLIESRKDKEKYVSCIMVIIQNVITFPVLKSSEVNNVKTATPTTAYVVLTLTLYAPYMAQEYRLEF